MQRLSQLFFVLFIVCFPALEGKLSQPKVVAGSAAIENQENIQWKIYSGERTIINWEEFSLNAQQSAHFFQATRDSAVLNRVVGPLPSSIDGLIHSNGKILLINEKGILIGPNGRINAASFIASTLDTSNDQFLKNEQLLFKGASSASVVNYGKITSPLGNIALIGLAVENYGEIEAQAGKIALAAGSEVLLLPESQEHLIIRVQRDDAGGAVAQEGVLSALQIEVAAAGTPYSLAIKSQGAIQASGVRKENGRVFLTAYEGDCHQTGTITAEEGTVHILGDRVALQKCAKIDVGGESQGGEVLIGGDYKGQNPTIKNAKQTHVVKGAEIKANASDGGDGGKIIVWSDDYTTCHGKLDASGGSQYGNGGFIEVSGRGLDFQADVNLLGPNGHVGELLLDPKFINIIAAGGDPIAGNSLFGDIPAGTANISGITLRNALNAANVTLQANTDVIFSDNVTVTNNTQRNLTVQAGRSIIVDPGFDIDIRRCNLIATINDAGAIPANRDAGLAQFSLGANSIIDTNRGGTNDGDVSITHGNFGGVSEGTIFIDTGSFIDFGAGTCTLMGTASPLGGSGQRGVEIHGRLRAQNNGSINITGVGALGGVGEGDNVGVLIGSGSRIEGNNTSTTNITATGGTGGLGGNDGLRVDNGWLDSNASNSTTIVGTSLATTGDSNIGVSFINTALVEVVNGSYSITGTGGNSVNGNIGVLIDSNSTIISSSDGTITLNGTGQGSGNNNVGTHINTTGSISSVQGDIDITGLGAVSAGSGNDGIILEGAITSTSAAAAAATITLDGTASSGTNAAGIRSSGGSGSITSISGDIDLTGAVLATSDSNSAGIKLQNFTITSTGGGANFADVSLNGTGATGVNLSRGVVMTSSSVNSNSGSITLSGTAQDTSATPVGADLSGTTLAITGTGIMGLTAVGGDFNVGQASDFDTMSGTFTMTAAENVVFANTPASTVNTTSGILTMTATNGGITLDDSGELTTVNANAILSANTAASLGAVDVGAAQISCTAQSIVNGLTVGTNLTAGTAILNSTNSIGTAPATGALAIQTDLGILQATISGAGDLVIFENDALVLNNISLSNGNIDINTGGAITQGGGTTVTVVGNAAFDTSRDGTVGTVQVTNNQATTVGTSVVAGDYLLTTSPASAISLSGSVDVGRNFTMVGTTFDRNNQTLRVAGSTTLNGLDPFQNNTHEVFPSGGGANFNISTVTLAATGDITVNLRETQYTAANVVLPNAIVLNNAGNSISGALQVTTVDPAISTSAIVDYDLTQGAPLLLNPGQNFTINAARGLSNPPLGVNNSPYGGSSLNGNNGSNVTLNLANTFGGWVSIKDPELATVGSAATLSLEHINTYGNLNITGTAGDITSGANGENVRTAGANNIIDTTGNVTVGGNVSALTTGGALTGQIRVSSNTLGALTGTGVIAGDTVDVRSVGGTIGTALQRIQTNSNNLGALASGDVYLEEVGGTIVGATVTGGIFDLTTTGIGDVFVGTPLGLTGVQTSGAGSNISIVPSNGAINVNAQVTSSGNGNITLTAAGANVAHLAVGDVSTVGGNIQVMAGGGPITMVDGTTYATGGGDATLSASTSIALGEIDAGLGDIFLTAMSGAITEVTAGATPNLTANRADLIATSGIGPINTAINQLEAEVTAPGNLAVTNTDALELVAWNGGAGGAVTNNGTITIITAANNLTVTDVVQTSGSNVITLTVDGSVIHAVTGDVSSNGGAIDVTATSGAITMADGTTYTTSGGNATLLANTNIALGFVNASAGDVFLTATTGEITDNIALETPNVIGDLGDFIAATGIGAGDDINTTLNTLEADVTGTGNLALTNTTTLALNGVSTSDGTITLVTSAGDLNVNNTVTAGAANIVTLTAANGVTHTAAGDVTSNGGAVNVTATAGSITMADGTVYTTNGANATLLAGTNIAFGLVDAGAGDIFATATTGEITDNIAAETPNLIGDLGDLIAATGIGAADDINATLNSLQADVTGVGNLALTNTMTLALNGVSTSDGNIKLVTTAGNLNVNAAVTAGGSNTVALTGAAAVTHIAAGDLSSSGGAINVTASAGNLTMADGTVFTTGGGNSTLIASGSILLGEVNTGAGNIAATATAGSITDNSSATNLTGNLAALTAALGAGTVGSPLQTNLTRLDGNITGVGDLAINETGALSVGNITTTNGGFQVTVNGVIDQIAATTLSINDFLRVNTSSDGTIGTTTILNTLPTTIGSSLVAGDYVFNVPTNTVDLSANITVGDDFIVTTTAYNDNGFTVTEGGVILINGVDPNLSGNTINATGIPPTFDLSVATFSAAGDITVNLRGDTNTFTNVQIANAVVFNNVGNAIGGTIEVTTVDPNFTGVTTQDYDLVQTTPFTLNGGQNMIINAARGSTNPPLGTLDSPYGGSSLNGNTGSNINLNQNNTFGGWVSLRDPQDATVQGISNIEVEHVNVYGNLTVNSTGGTLVTGSNSESVRAVETIDFDANGAITIDGAVSSLTTGGAPSQTVSYNGNSLGGIATTTATGIDMTTTGGINLQTAADDLVFTAGGNVSLIENDAVTVAGDTTGSIVIATSNPGNITIDSVTVGSLTEIGLSGSTVDVTTNAGDILVNEATTSVSGITLTGTGGSVTHTATGDLSATNGPIQVTAGTGAIMMVNGTTYMTGGGNATLLANTNIALGEINAGNGNISCTATGGTMTDVTGSATSQNLLGTTGTLSAANGIGTGTSSGIGNIGTDLTNLIASTTTGNIVIREIDGLNLGNIVTGAGNFDLDAGGLITQSGGTTLSIVGDLLLMTDRDTAIGTVEILNSAPTSLGASQVAGNYTLTTTPLSAVQLLANLEVAGDMNMTGTTFTDNGFNVLAGGDVFFNGVDTDLSGNVINAKGIPVDFNISLATPAVAGDITINLRGFVENYNNPQFADAIILNNSGNSVSGQIDIQTVDPILTGLVSKDFNLVQTAPLTLNPGQNLIINAARGVSNPPLGVMDSPYGGSTLNGGDGSNITLMQSNNLGGWISIRDPNLALLTQSNNVALAHVNTYGNFNATSTTGDLTVGTVVTESTRSAGATNTLTANTNVTISESLLALDTGGTRFGSFEITTQTGSISSTAATETQASALRAPNGNIGTTLQPFLLDSPVCAYIGGGDVTMDALDILTVGGSSSGGDTLINETVAGTLTVGTAVAGTLSQTGLTNTGGAITLNTISGDIQLDASVIAPGQTITLLGQSGAIMQSAGEVTTQNTGTLDVTADLGITGYGVDSALHTNAQTLSAVNGVSGELNIKNTSANTSIVTLQNGAGGADFGRPTFFSQQGGSSVQFNTLSGDGTAALLSLTGAADMIFSGNVAYGGDFIAATNHTMNVQAVTLDFQGVAALIVDQQNLTKVAGGQFINQGTFTVATDNLAIYAASGPQAPASSPVNPSNLVQLGSLSSLETWDQSETNGLATKYETSYSAGGPNAGAGFGTNYAPGNGTFGSQVIWYKESLTPPAPTSGGLDRSALRIVGINSDVSLQYFLYTWDRQTHYLIDYVCQKNVYKLPCLPEDTFAN